MEHCTIIRDKLVLEQIKSYYYSVGNQRDLLLFTMGINTGLKLNELLSLSISDVRGKSYLEISQSRFGISKRIPLNQEIQCMIKDFTSGKSSSSPLFESSGGRRVDRTTVYRNFKEVCQSLSLDTNITLASLRKTFGYHYYRSYGDLSLLQWLFNHNSVIDTMRYLGISDDLSSHFKLLNL